MRSPQQSGAANPFNGVDVGWSQHRPSFADLDGDGDLDAVVGERYGTVRYFKNTGSATALRSSPNRPGQPIRSTGSMWASVAAPSFADLDGDGDLGMVLSGRWMAP